MKPFTCHSVVLLSSLFVSTIAVAEGSGRQWEGFYGGLHAATSHVNLSGTTWTIDPNSPVGGGRGTDAGSDSWNGTTGGLQLGYNWMMSRNILLGVEGSLGATFLQHDTQGVSKQGISDKTINFNGLSTIRGRAGYVLDDWLLFGTAGLSVSEIKSSNIQGLCGNGATPPVYSVASCSVGPYNAVPYGTKDTSSKYLFGWNLGLGAEYALTKDVSAKFEYLYTRFNTWRMANPSFNRESDYKIRTDTWQVGVNYRF